MSSFILTYAFTMKLCHILLLVGVTYNILNVGHSSASEVINIGALVSLNSINGKVLAIAIKAAVEDINSSPNILGGRNLSVRVHDSEFSGFLSIMGALQFMETDTVAIVGPHSSTAAHVLAHLTNQLHVPLLSPTALDPSLSPMQFPYFFQTAPSDLFQMTAIADIIQYFGWTQVIAIYTDEDHSRNGINALREGLTKLDCKITHKVVLPQDPRENPNLVIRQLSQVKTLEARVIVLHTMATLGPMVLNIANQIGILETGYVWIATSWLSTALESEKHPEIVKMTQGVITLRIHTPESERKSKFMARWNKLSKGSTGLTVYGLYAYDTVWLIAKAVRKYLDEGNNISFSFDPVLSAIGGGNLNLSALSKFDGGKQMLRILSQTNLTGLTGRFQFDSDRDLVNPSYDILNIVGNQLRQIGFWSNYSGLSVVDPEILQKGAQNLSSASQTLHKVIWPGGAKQQPRGWVFPSNGRKLRIGIPRRVSFPGCAYEDNHTHEVRGYCIDVFLSAIELLPYAVPYEFNFFGDGHQNPNYTDLISRIATGEFDAVVGDIAIVTWRTRIADFTQPYLDSGLVVVAPVKKSSSNAWAFLRPFTPFLWAVTGSFLLIIGTVMWTLEHSVNDEFRGAFSDQLITVLWFSFSTFFFTHRESTVSMPGRLVLAVWLFVAYTIQQSYTANLTSFLTVEQLSSPIKDIHSLVASSLPIGIPEGSYVGKYLNEELHIPSSRLVHIRSPAEYADALEKGKVAAVVDERPYMDLFLSKRCQFAIAGQQFTNAGWGFAFEKDSPLAVDMSNALLKLWEKGILRNITETWFRNRKACRSQIIANESNRLQLQNTSGMFIVCAATCIIALIIHFCSMYWFRHTLPQQPGPSTPSRDSSPSMPQADKKEDLQNRRSKKRRMSRHFSENHEPDVDLE